MNILGIGPISARGLGIRAWEEALRSGWQPPSLIETGRPGEKPRLAYTVDLDAVPDRTLLKKLRRADKLSKMAVLAAADALADGGFADAVPPRLGIILATGFGPHVTTFEFLDGILDFGDAAASPTAFSHSVHNAAASYVASTLRIQGPTLTVTRFRFSFQEALLLGQTWLDQGRCDYLLVGAAEQYGQVLGHVADRLRTPAVNGRIAPFCFRDAGQVPGEGAAFFLLGREASDRTYCRIEAVSTWGDPDPSSARDLDIIDSDGNYPGEETYLSLLGPEAPAAAYGPLVGSMMTGSAFSLAAGALMLKRQELFAAPVTDNPRGLLLQTGSGTADVRSIRCIDASCAGDPAVARLRASVAS